MTIIINNYNNYLFIIVNPILTLSLTKIFIFAIKNNRIDAKIILFIINKLNIFFGRFHIQYC